MIDAYLLGDDGKLKPSMEPGARPSELPSIKAPDNSRAIRCTRAGSETGRDAASANTGAQTVMIYEEINSESRARRTLTGATRVLSALKIDGPLVTGLALIAVYGLIVLYSASGQSVPTIIRTVVRIFLGAIAMLVLARVNPNFLRRTTPWLYVIGVFLLIVVAAFGHIGLGAQRWLSIGFVRFQPSELMKLAVPMMCAWYLHERPLPPSFTLAAGARRAHPRAGWVGRSRARPRHRRTDRRCRSAGHCHGRTASAHHGCRDGAGRGGRRGSAGASCTTTSASAC